MAVLNTKERNNLPGKEFAVPGRKYPIQDKVHAQNALARVSQFGSSKEKAEVQSKVAKKFGMGSKVQALKKKASQYGA